ncbi:hypothetical protein M670_00126 [Schinkia azotoformans MEV2011]|uniref:BppU N-terminal domain-containing protein n=1 Tax=Schinkia azotoformans MEV2011 TaxID=1348973 RepID=A0A072NRR1_SCHAZ|nr:hypothetical protein [Schinkia azotoformans]KEF40111.1 hypothetical protein M670_00126 [Schinkia azotoformans MEV2011]
MKTINKQTINIDLFKPTIIQLPKFIQGDTNIVEFNVKDNGIDADLNNIGRIVVNYKRPDSTVISRLLTAVGNIATYQIGVDEMLKAGYGEVEIQFFSLDDLERISTKRFKIYLAESIGTDKIYENDNDLTLLQDLFIEVETVKTSVDGAESNREASEAIRVDNESLRQANETARETAEQGRVSAESSRVNAETSRESAESTRQSNENSRKTAESTRQSQESTRQSQEATRQTNTQTAINNVNNKLAELEGLSVVQYNDRLVEVENVLSDQAYQQMIIGHGTSIIQATQASSLKVEISGNTLINIVPPKIAKFAEDTNADGIADGWSANNSTMGKYSVINNVQTIEALVTDTSNVRAIKSLPMPYKAGKYYIAVVDVTIGVGASAKFLMTIGSGAMLESGVTITASKTAYFKFAPTQDNTDARFWLQNNSAVGSTGKVEFKNLRQIEISADIYNKLGVTLLDADVERMFPYVSGIQSVKNPVLLADGENVIDVYAELSKIASTLVNRLSENEIEIIPNLTPFNNKVIGTFAKNTQYTFAFDIRHEGSSRGIYFIIDYSDGTNDTLTVNSVNMPYETIALTSKVNKTISGLRLTYGSSTTKTFLRNFRINIGTVSKQFSPYNPSYLYAEITLAGNDNKKDILTDINYEIGKARKIKWWETDVALDGTKAWVYSVNDTGFKKVKVPLNSLVQGSLDMYGVKYDGKIIKAVSTFGSVVSDTIYADTTYVSFGIANVDSGWTDAMTPTPNMIKGLANGWRYTGNGTNHSWVSVLDGTTVPTTQSEAFVSANKVSPNWGGLWKLTYQLATPVIEAVTVEGDLVANGATQIEVGNSVMVREKATPVYSNADKSYFINLTALPSSVLKNKVQKIISIYKNGKIDNKWSIALLSTAHGNERAKISEEYFDPTAEYSVTYIALNEGQSANLTEVKCTYDQSLKSAVDSQVTKLSDVATDVSVLDRQVYLMLLAMKNAGMNV